jgi:hypothetical protein
MKLMIHYTSPADDPGKVPRPHTYDTATRETTGGEIGEVNLLGISRQADDLTFYPSDWSDAVELHDRELEVYAGWYANFDSRDTGPFTYTQAIERVEEIA